MNQKQKTKSQSPPSPKNKGIFINDINYSYSITKSEGNEDSLLLKLFNPDKKSNVYFTYESPMEKLIKEVKFLSIYETLDEIIEFLKDIINEGDASVEEKDGVYTIYYMLKSHFFYFIKYLKSYNKKNLLKYLIIYRFMIVWNSK